MINNLEVETNLTLFDRSGKFPVLTEHGKALYSYAKNLAEYTQSFEQVCHSIENGIETDITIYHTDLVPTALIQDLMKEIRKDFRDVNIHWLHRSNSEIDKGIKSGNADIGLVLANDAKAISQTDYIYWISMPFCLCAAPSSPIFSEVPISLGKMKKFRQLVLEDYFSAEIESTVVVSSRFQRIENMNIFLSLLSAGDGWAFVPKHTVQTMLNEKALIEFTIKELNVPVRFPIMIWSNHQSKSGPVQKRIIELLNELAIPYQ